MSATTEKIERCTAGAAGFRISGTDNESNAEAVSLLKTLDDYFHLFAAPRDGKCLKCGRIQGGAVAALMGGFRFGLAYGEGHCVCGWPARAYHFPKDADGNEIFTNPVKIILQYHPDEVADQPTEIDETT